jgi:hypothetical protein
MSVLTDVISDQMIGTKEVNTAGIGKWIGLAGIVDVV